MLANSSQRKYGIIDQQDELVKQDKGMHIQEDRQGWTDIFYQPKMNAYLTQGDAYGLKFHIDHIHKMRRASELSWCDDGLRKINMGTRFLNLVLLLLRTHTLNGKIREGEKLLSLKVKGRFLKKRTRKNRFLSNMDTPKPCKQLQEDPTSW